MVALKKWAELGKKKAERYTKSSKTKRAANNFVERPPAFPCFARHSMKMLQIASVKIDWPRLEFGHWPLFNLVPGTND